MALPQLPLQNKKLIFIVAGVVLLGVAFVLVNTEFQRQQQEATKKANKKFQQMQAEQTAVLIAKKNIPKGTVIDSTMLDTKIFPNKYVQPQAATSLDRVSGMVAVMDIPQDDQITLAKVSGVKSAGVGLASVTPIGKRAITITVDNMASLSGMVKPGNYVDIIALIQVPVQGPDGKTTGQVAVVPLFQNVLVLAVGQDTSGGMTAQPGSRYAKTDSGESVGGNPLITVALSPQEASLIAFVQEQGKMRLTLRSPSDAGIEPIQPASWDTLFRYIMPQQQPRAETGGKEMPQPVVVEQGPTVEIYRGLNKEIVPLSK